MADAHDISLYANLRDRDLRNEGILVAEGRLLTARLFASGLEVLSVLCSEGMAPGLRELAAGRCPVHVIGNDEMERLAGFRFHRGVMAAARRPALPSLGHFLARDPACRSIVVCAGLSNDVNQGGIVRTAAALGADAVCVAPNGCDLFSRRALKASMGAALTLPIVAMDDSEKDFSLLKKCGFTVYGATTGEGSVPLREVQPAEKRAVVFGNEAEGIPEEMRSCCDELVHVPMHNNTDSLNVGVAAGVVLYKLFYQG